MALMGLTRFWYYVDSRNSGRGDPTTADRGEVQPGRAGPTNTICRPSPTTMSASVSRSHRPRPARGSRRSPSRLVEGWCRSPATATATPRQHGYRSPRRARGTAPARTPRRRRRGRRRAPAVGVDRRVLVALLEQHPAARVDEQDAREPGHGVTLVGGMRLVAASWSATAGRTVDLAREYGLTDWRSGGSDRRTPCTERPYSSGHADRRAGHDGRHRRLRRGQPRRTEAAGPARGARPAPRPRGLRRHPRRPGLERQPAARRLRHAAGVRRRSAPGARAGPHHPRRRQPAGDRAARLRAPAPRRRPGHRRVRVRGVRARTPRWCRSPTRCAAAGHCPRRPRRGRAGRAAPGDRRGAGAVARGAVRRPRRRRPPRRPSGPGSRSSGCSPSRTAPPSASCSGCTPPSPPSSTRSPGSTRCASGPGRCARSRWPARAGRPTRSPCCARCATCSTRSSAWSPDRSCAPSSPRCSARRRPPRPSRRRRRPRAARTGRGGRHAPLRSRPCGAGRWPAATRSSAALTDLVDRVVAGAALAPRSSRSPATPASARAGSRSRSATYAADQGMTIAWGRCSQDDGAPALWPWATVLERLGSELPERGTGDDSGAAFRAWEIGRPAGAERAEPPSR